MEKICKLSGKVFSISEQDLEFYRKLSPKFAGEVFQIPAPELSFEGRLIRRMSWRNDRSFYKRKCSHTGKELVSIYPQETKFPVFHPDIWWSDVWDAKQFGQDIDFNRPFFEQWHELFNKVPRKGIDIVNCENSYYCNYCGDAKNCYLDIAGEGNEDCYFNLFTKHSKDCTDCTFVYNSQLVYESIICYGCQNVVCGYYLENCFDCYFSYDLKGCSNCLFCSNLRHKKYHIHNKPVSKKKYEETIAALNLANRESFESHRASWKEVIKSAAHRDMYNLNSENCSGNNIHNSKNCHYCFNISKCWDCKYLFDVLDAKDCYDLNYSLYKPEASMELISTLSMRYSAFCMASHYCHSAYYCDQCENSNNIFGCIGLNQGKYCILNKQYSSEDYEKNVARLIRHMQETKEWGEFFPWTLSPWGYNETVANEYYPFPKDFAESKGFNWREDREEISLDGALEAPSEIDRKNLAEVLNAKYICSDSDKAYRVIKQELEFYIKMGLPIPNRCPDARHSARIALRNPRRLYKSKCVETGKNIFTTYEPSRPEKVYCEEAYLEKLV